MVGRGRRRRRDFVARPRYGKTIILRYIKVGMILSKVFFRLS
jgi:hypothetical protein